MKLTVRVSAIALTVLAGALFGALACNDSNNPAPGTGNSEKGGSSSKGGATATSTTDVGGTSTTTATGSGGATATGSGGATTTATESGGATASGGATNTTTTPSTAGAAACNYPTTAPPVPTGGTICDSTVKKGGTCTTEGAVCYKSCGPTNSGWKTETCTSGVYVEVSACIWTASDYSAFKVPATLAEIDPLCPASAPQASAACSIPSCIPCADPSTGGYLDSTGAAKSGWCECAAIDATTGQGKWTCGGSGTAWPCPGQAGC